MEILFVVDRVARWKIPIPLVRVVDAAVYLTQPEFAHMPRAKVFNLCRSYRYQSIGYYVSLLAEARGHKPQPSVTNIMDFRSTGMVKFLATDLEDLIQQSLKPLQSDTFELSVYFGKSLAKRYQRLARRLFNLFHAPFLRAHFQRKKDTWTMRSVGPIAADQVPDDHMETVIASAQLYFTRRRWATPPRQTYRYDLAILIDPEEKSPPSNKKAVVQFVRAAASLGLNTQIVTKDDLGRISEFDALFIRTTTGVNHFSYRFSRRAATEGLVVIDDPTSIIRCANKVYLAEQLTRHGLQTPKTMILSKKAVGEVERTLGFPCVLKQPDSQFSLGVRKVSNRDELDRELDSLFKISDLVIAQEFLKSDFDWRVGVLNKKPLFACKYYMAPQHWQIIRQDAVGDDRYGDVVSVALADVPPRVMHAALKSSSLMGNGLYGVDLKEVGNRVVVIEVNDNPNIDYGFEDSLAGKDLYLNVMIELVNRLEQRTNRLKEGNGSHV